MAHPTAAAPKPSPQTGTGSTQTSAQHPAAPAPPAPPINLTAVERLLWTPTPGQDVTKTLFPLTPDTRPKR